MLYDSPVKYKKSTHRTTTPEDTLNKISKLGMKIGLTRTSDITHLDRIGVPVYTSVRPLAEERAVSVYAGKGPSKVHAKVSSIMEAIERYSAEMNGSDESIIASYDSKTCLNPESLILPRNTSFNELEWVKGYSVKDDDEIYIPVIVYNK